MLKNRLLIILSLLLLPWVSGRAQQVSVSACLDSNHIVIGDQLKLHLSVVADTNSTITIQDANKWQLINCEVVESLPLNFVSNDSKRIYNQDVIITSFDTGTAQIPEIPVFVNDTLLAAKTSPLSFRVDSLPVFVDTSAAFKDIVLPMDGKDVEIIKPENSGRNWLRIILLIVAILALIALAIFLLRKYLLPYLRKRKLEQMKALLKQNAGTVALNSLKGLKSKKLWQKGQVKDYYSELSMILRTYLDQQWDVNAKEMVTDEIMEAIDKLDLDDDLTKELYRFFVLSDLVKYAKKQPEVEAHETSLKNAYNFVRVTDKQEHAKAAAEQAEKSKRRR